MDPECRLNPQKRTDQIMDYVRVFFKFLLGRLQRHGAEIVDIAMLWPLLDTESIKNLFKDSIVWFGFKESDLPNLKILLAATHKYHQLKMGDKVESKETPKPGSDDTNTDKQDDSIQAKDEKEYDLNDDIEAKVNNLMKVVKYMYCNQSAVPLHDAPVDELLKTHDVYKDFDTLNIDDEMRKVVERIVAVVIYTLNIGVKTCLQGFQGLYGPETGKTVVSERQLDKDNRNNNATVVTTNIQESLTQSTELLNKKSGFEAITTDNIFEEHNNQITIEGRGTNPERAMQAHTNGSFDDHSENVVPAIHISNAVTNVEAQSGKNGEHKVEKAGYLVNMSPVMPEMTDKKKDVNIEEDAQKQENTEDSLYQVIESFYIQKSKEYGDTYNAGREKKIEGADAKPNGRVSDTISEEEEIALLERNISFDETIKSLEDSIDYNMEIKLLFE